MITKYDHFLKKRTTGNNIKTSLENNKISSDKSQKRIKNKAELKLESKRGDTEIRRRPKELMQPYSFMSPNKNSDLFTSHSKYVQPNTSGNDCISNKRENKMNFDTLQNLKSKRSSRRERNKDRDATYISKSPLTNRNEDFHLPSTGKNNGCINSRINPAHIKSLSSENHSTANTTSHPYSLIQTKRDHPKYANIWVEERISKLNRYRQTENMVGVLFKQKLGNF